MTNGKWFFAEAASVVLRGVPEGSCDATEDVVLGVPRTIPLSEYVRMYLISQ